MNKFNLVSAYQPSGDQPQAIRELTEAVDKGVDYQTLLRVTGSGKTFTMANVIANVNRPTLIISHNKTLAAQFYVEFKAFFPDNAVEYFVSYYDYYSSTKANYCKYKPTTKRGPFTFLYFLPLVLPLPALILLPSLARIISS